VEHVQFVQLVKVSSQEYVKPAQKKIAAHVIHKIQILATLVSQHFT
jgi:hypothetical protein